MPRDVRAAPSSIRFVTNFLRPVRRSVFTNENPFVLSVSRCIGGRVVPKETDETSLVSGNGKMKEAVLMKIRLFLSVLHREYVVYATRYHKRFYVQRSPSRGNTR